MERRDSLDFLCATDVKDACMEEHRESAVDARDRDIHVGLSRLRHFERIVGA